MPKKKWVERPETPYVRTLSDKVHEILNRQEFNPYVRFGKCTKEGLKLLEETKEMDIVFDNGWFTTTKRVSRAEYWLHELRKAKEKA